MKHKPKLHVVVHALLGYNFYIHARDMSLLAHKKGADSILLIPDYNKGTNRKPNLERMIDLYSRLKESLPNIPIGVNFLTKEHSDQDLKELLNKHKFFSYQSDGSISDKNVTADNPNCIFFSGIAFKYGPDERAGTERLIELCKVYDGKPKNLIPTTSGAATGVAADIHKIKTLVKNLNGRRLALASGVTLENVTSYLDVGITDFIVSTSLVARVDDSKYDIFSEEKIEKLAGLIHSYK